MILTFDGDPTILGWATFGLYMVAAALTLRAAKTVQLALEMRPGRRGWTALSILLFLLGLNKQLDVQTLLIANGRHWANLAGLNFHYRDLQLVFFVGLTLLLLAVVTLNARMLAALCVKRPIVGAGFGFVFAYAFIRAGSMLHVDQMLLDSPADLPGLWALEVFGLGFVIVGCQPSEQKSSPAGERTETESRH